MMLTLTPESAKRIYERWRLPDRDRKNWGGFVRMWCRGIKCPICKACNGHGRVTGGSIKLCDTCKGTGFGNMKDANAFL